MKKKTLGIEFKNIFSYLFLFLLILFVPLVYSNSVLDPSLYPRLFALNITVTVFMLLMLLLKSSDLYDTGVFKNNIFKFYLGYILFAAISIVFALNISEAIFEWFKTFTFFITFCLLTIYLSQIKNASVIITKVVAVFSLMISLYGFYEIFNLVSTYGMDHQKTYLIRALSSNRNLYSQILFLSLPFTLFGIYRFRSFWRILCVISSVFIFVLITVLLTRSVWVAFVFAVFIAIIVLIIYRKSFMLNKRVVKVLSISSLFIIVVISISVLIYSRYGNVEVFEKQFYWIRNYQFGSTLERTELGGKTFKMGIDQPATGVGQGNWRFVIPAYGLEKLRSETGETYFQRPHNDFLWVLSETGIIGFVFYLMIFISSIFYLFKLIKNAEKIKDKYFALALLFGLAGYLVISLVSFPKERIEHQIFLSLMLAAAVVKYNSLVPTNRKTPTETIIMISIPVIILLIFGTYISQNRMASAKHIRKALDFRVGQKWQKVIGEMDKAITPFTKVDDFSTPLFWYKGEAYFKLNNIDSAHYCFNSAYLTNPNHLHVLNNLGTTYELKKDHKTAKKYFLKAVELSPHFEESLLNLCAIYYNQNRMDSAYLMLYKINDTTKNVRYEKFLTAVLWKKINEFSKEIDERQLRNSIIRIRNDNKWMKKAYLQSINKNIDIEQQFLLEAIYLMESVDSTITPKEGERLKIKYNLSEQ